MESEEWREIKGYKGIYQVSNLGRVKSLDRTIRFSDGRERKYVSKILSSKLSNRGYLMVTLWRNRDFQRLSIHRLVAEAFIPNPDNLPIPLKPRLLEWLFLEFPISIRFE